jgi:hypothetical protein
MARRVGPAKNSGVQRKRLRAPSLPVVVSPERHAEKVAAIAALQAAVKAAAARPGGLLAGPSDEMRAAYQQFRRSRVSPRRRRQLFLAGIVASVREKMGRRDG